jgi:flavin-dependent dehydrogenase
MAPPFTPAWHPLFSTNTRFVPLLPRKAGCSRECRIGDALTMIPPVTGNGMSMALESAELAAPPLMAYCLGEVSWSCAQQQIARACDLAFERRLRWGRRVQFLMFASARWGWVSSLALQSLWLWRALFNSTR